MKKKNIILVLVCIIAVLLVGLVYFRDQYKKKTAENDLPETNTADNTQEPENVPDDNQEEDNGFTPLEVEEEYVVEFGEEDEGLEGVLSD